MDKIYIESNLKRNIFFGNVFKARVIKISDDFIIASSEEKNICIAKDKSDIKYSALTIEGIPDFCEMDITLGDKLTIDADSIKIGTQILIKMKDYDVIGMKSSLEFKPQPNEKLTADNLRELEECICRYGKCQGISPIIYNIGDYIKELETYSKIQVHNSMYTSLIFTRMISLLEKLVQGKFENIETFVEDIIKFGSESNNSSKEFICGMIAVFIYGDFGYEINHENIINFNKQFIDRFNMSVEEDSAFCNIFEKSVQGEKQIISLIGNITRSSDVEVIKSSVKLILDLNCVSGTDFLSGIYMGFRVLEKEKFRNSINRFKMS